VRLKHDGLNLALCGEARWKPIRWVFDFVVCVKQKTFLFIEIINKAGYLPVRLGMAGIEPMPSKP
jgi:hypothetical protein